MRRPRLLPALGGLLALLLLLLLVLPMLFKDKIAARVKTAVNQNVKAHVDWRHLGVSFFRHFPNLTLTLDDLTAVGVDRFQGDTLAAVQHFRLSVSLPSVLGSVMGGSGPIVVRNIELDQPRLRLIALEDGTANWDISRESGARRSGAVQGHGPESAPLRDQGWRHRLRQSASEAEGNPQGPQPVAQRRLQPEARSMSRLGLTPTPSA